MEFCMYKMQFTLFEQAQSVNYTQGEEWPGRQQTKIWGCNGSQVAHVNNIVLLSQTLYYHINQENNL